MPGAELSPDHPRAEPGSVWLRSPAGRRAALSLLHRPGANDGIAAVIGMGAGVFRPVMDYYRGSEEHEKNAWQSIVIGLDWGMMLIKVYIRCCGTA